MTIMSERLATTHGPAPARAVGAAIALTLTVAVGVYFPILSLIVLCYLASRLRSCWPVAVAVVASITSVLAWMNVQKAVEGDWVWYTGHFTLLTKLPLDQYLGHRIPPFTIKSTEPVYYTISFALARLTDGHIPALAIAVTALVYLPVGLAVAAVVRRLAVRPAAVGGAVAVAMLVGITFTITTHLVRQEVGGAFLLLGLVAVYCGRQWLGGTLLVLALLSHNSIVIPFGAVVAARVILGTGGRLRWAMVAVAAAVFFVAGVIYTRLPSSAGYAAELNDDGSVGAAVIIFDVALLALFVGNRQRLLQLGVLPHVLIGAVLVYAGFLLGVSPAPIPFLRMYLHLEFARALMIGCLVAMAIRSRYAVYAWVPMFAVAVAYLELRIALSPFSFEGGFISHVLRSALAAPGSGG